MQQLDLLNAIPTDNNDANKNENEINDSTEISEANEIKAENN